jgi:hypothetical protein
VRDVAAQLIGQGKVTNSHRAWLGPATLADVLAGLRPGQTVMVAAARPGGAGRTVRVSLGQFPG